jgi:1-phosphatidylinositol-4-phosphate 5-kinase
MESSLFRNDSSSSSFLREIGKQQEVEMENSKVKFYDHSPQAFHHLRKHWGVDTEEYVHSMQSVCKEKFSDGKSGAFLYFTGDQNYIVKTCTKVPSAHVLCCFVLKAYYGFRRRCGF